MENGNLDILRKFFDERRNSVMEVLIHKTCLKKHGTKRNDGINVFIK